MYFRQPNRIMVEEYDIKILKREIKIQKEHIKQLKKLLKDSQKICNTLQKQIELNQEHEQILLRSRNDYEQLLKLSKQGLKKESQQHNIPSHEPNDKAEIDLTRINRAFARGIWQAKHQQYAKAIDIFSKLVKQIPSSACSWYNLGMLYYATSQIQQACQCAEKAASLGFEPAQKLLDKCINL